METDDMVLRVRNGLLRFLAALDSEGVGLFQAVVYIHVIMAGIYGLFIAGAVPQAVEKTMGHDVNRVWLGLCIGASVCLVGKVLRNGWQYLGLWLQVAGDLFVTGAFTAYVIATVQTTDWAKALFAVFVIAALADCAALLLFRDIRRIAQVEREVRR